MSGQLLAAAAAAPTQPARPAAPQAAAPTPPAGQLSLRRRHAVVALPSLLLGVAALGAAGPARAAAEAALAAAPPSLLRPDSLAARMVNEGNIQQPGNMPPWAPKQLYFPRWLFGEWEVEMVFTGLRVPLGREFVPPGFLQAAEAPAEDGGLGSRYAFRQRFYSTLPDTFDNQLRMNLGIGMPRDAIIADRAFNTRESTNAFLGWQAVESVDYSTRDNPLRQVVTLSTLAPDTAPLPPRRLELFFNNLSQEGAGTGPTEGSLDPGEGDDAFYTSELCRQVLLGLRQAEVKDYEVLHSYRQLSPGMVTGRQRSCLYLQPQETLYFKALGRAVAVYDYDVTMKRVAPEPDAPQGAVACVPTPKDIFQCI